MRSTRNRTAAITIVQPYVPKYRVPLFERLVQALHADGVRCDVVAPPPASSQRKRMDAITESGTFAPSWLTSPSHGPKQIRIGPATFTYYGSIPNQKNADAVVAPFAGTSFDTHWAVANRRPVGLWGHIAPFIAAPNRADLFVERHLMRRSEHLFTYTEAGARFAQSANVARSKITVLNNTISTSAITSGISGSADLDVTAARRKHSVESGTITFGWLGGLDGDKRVDLFAAVLDELNRRDSPIRFLVYGRGEQERLLYTARDRGQVKLLGYAGDQEKIELALTCSALFTPGRVGLVAVDALAMQLPIISLRNNFHAPEIDYLTEGSSLHYAPNTPPAIADFLTNFQRTRFDTLPPRLEDTVESFVTGIHALLSNAR